MGRFLTYRTPLFLLMLTFALFNIGLPVVLDACPMASAMGTGNCAGCHEGKGPSGDLSLGLPSGSCCSTTTVGDRNTNEFEQLLRQARGYLVHPTMVALVPAPFVDRMDVRASICSIAPSPPPVSDRTLLTSSLLL
jgi:hypothetical protein